MRLVRTGMILVSACALAAPALADDFVYTPINPSFGGSPLNSAHLLGTAGAQREATASDAEIDEMLAGPGEEDTGNENAELFVRQLEGRLLSALAGQVTEAIFGENRQDSGVVTFGDTEVSFTRTLDSIRLTITDYTDGSITEIVVPQLMTIN